MTSRSVRPITSTRRTSGAMPGGGRDAPACSGDELFSDLGALGVSSRRGQAAPFHFPAVAARFRHSRASVIHDIHPPRRWYRAPPTLPRTIGTSAVGVGLCGRDGCAARGDGRARGRRALDARAACSVSARARRSRAAERGSDPSLPSPRRIVPTAELRPSGSCWTRRFRCIGPLVVHAWDALESANVSYRRDLDRVVALYP